MVHTPAFADPNARPASKDKKQTPSSGRGGGGDGGGGGGGAGGGGGGSGGSGWPQGGGRFRTMGDLSGSGSKYGSNEFALFAETI